jgi:phosphatidylglycerol:prolipoprotein diacylglycerol transferase
MAIFVEVHVVHSLDPVLLPIYGNIAIRWYGLAYLAGFIAAYFLISWLVKRKGLGWPAQQISDLITYGAIGVLVGGRVGYALFYSPDLFIRFRAEAPFWGLLAVNEGGMASHGGMIGLVLGCWLFARKYKVSPLIVFDLVAISGPIGIFFGRIANFINGELVGRPMEQAWPWGVKFPSDIEFWPAQAPEKLRELGQAVALLPGQTRELWDQAVARYLSVREGATYIHQTLHEVVVATQKGQAAMIQALEPVLTLRHPSQLYEALLEGALVFVVLMYLSSRDRKPGLVGASFLMVYAIARIIGEQFRMPDAHIGFDWLGLTRGQWLSLGMFVIGIALYFFWNQQMASVVPGWRKAKSVKVSRRHSTN